MFERCAWSKLGQESYGRKPGPFTLQGAGGRLNWMLEFSSRHRFHQQWAAHRQDPDSSYIELYRHTTCPEAGEKKQRTSLRTREMLQETQLQHRLPACFKTGTNKWQQSTLPERASAPAVNSQGHKLQPHFLTRLPWTSKTRLLSATSILPQ